MNKRGQTNSRYFGIIIAFLVLIVLSIVLYVNSDIKFSSLFGERYISFGEVFGSGFVFLDYVFGKIPSALVDATFNDSSYVAAILIIAITSLFVLAFGDILSIFGVFSKPVSWVMAAVLALIVANLKGIVVLVLYSLAFTSIFGSVAVIMGIIWSFSLFILFHFGSQEIRRWIIQRKAEDSAMRAVAGGKKVASGIAVLREIADEAERAERGR